MVAVAGHADYQARHLRDSKEFGYIPLLLDPEGQLRHSVGAGRLSWTGLVSPKGAWRYLQAVSGARQGKIVAGWNLSPAVLLGSPQLDVVESWIGTTYGDYPELAVVVDKLRRSTT